jgi:hypothetical protein
MVDFPFTTTYFTLKSRDMEKKKRKVPQMVDLMVVMQAFAG